MKKILLALVFVPVVCSAQNIIPNPSFEIQTACPIQFSGPYYDEVMKATGWSTFRGPPDLFDSCGGGQVTIPNNYFGHQETRTGSAYCGCHTYWSNSYREIIGCQLLTSMTIGQTYYIHFYVSPAKGGNQVVTLASNNMGVKFSTIPYIYPNEIPINNVASFYSNTIVTDTDNWTEISGSFIADSAYEYAAFGNFFDNGNTSTIPFDGIGGGFAYYFIDDICVSDNSKANCDFPLSVGSVRDEISLTVFPNPASDVFHVSTPEPGAHQIKLINNLG